MPKNALSQLTTDKSKGDTGFILIPDYGIIGVTKDGKILAKCGKIMKPSIKNTKVYERVHIGKRLFAVHRLVALAFLGAPKGKRNQVNHKNGNHLDNRFENLEWSTGSENVRHSLLNNLSGCSKITQEIADAIRRDYATKKYTYRDLQDKYGINYSTIGYIVRNECWNYQTGYR